MNDSPHIPTYSDLLWPTLRAVREIGNSGTNEEIVERVLANEGFTEEQRQGLADHNGHLYLRSQARVDP